MPRAFLITRRRYDNGAENFEETMRDSSPERGVSVAEFGGGQPTSDGASECGSETSSECPEELYNLTKLAEVSLAAAAGTLIHPAGGGVGVNCLQGSGSPCRRREDLVDLETVGCDNRGADGQALEERTRLFFERIEAERKIFDRRSPSVESRGVQRIVRNVTPRKEHTTITKNRKTNNNGNRKSSLNFVQNRVDNLTKSDQENEDHECPDCGKRYSTSSNLARHRQTHRSLGDKKARRCPHCDKVYVSMPAFSMHVRTHNQGCKCHYCGKCFSRPWLLQGHIRTHTGEKPFKCTICNKAFADKSNLRAHIQTHSNTKPHVCGRCGKAFALKSYLYKHEESSCMRAAHHRDHRASSEKREPEPQRVSPLPRRISAPVTASPTSVIVPRLQNLGKIVSSTGSLTPDQQVQVFSAIRHTKSSGSGFDIVVNEDGEREGEIESGVGIDEKNSKQPAAVEIFETEIPTEIEKPEKRVDAQMVIRTSVISPNPEHLGRLSAAAAGNRKSNFDFNPSRNSAFSRTGGMTLNLAIA